MALIRGVETFALTGLSDYSSWQRNDTLMMKYNSANAATCHKI